MSAQYVPVLLTFAFAAVMASAIVGLSAVLGRGKLVHKRKLEPYESGMLLIDASRKRVSVKFFTVAMVFIVFDVEVAFLYPWAVSVKPLLAEGNTLVLWDGLIFLLLVTIGYVYLWREGAFDWAKRGSEQ
ncbi:MAG: NADH-quinone oxidoreductase subunit A [Thermoanaerobaculum sp.]|jgi:NADH:ubiquinone oxidoreductase subunit 3 (subunit A)|uniref:NADH-quinone oxidoreductase subunit A n=1 Tax=Thermoanaerobaculum aquaticum TaxID=1312852 RepID=A0A7C2NTN3_9BACT|nr:MAG: NADH-quinone oxidoreductase subunit A [Thermoanaerobaculum sp.]